MSEDAELRDALVELDNLRRRDMRRRLESETLLRAVQVLADDPDGHNVMAPMLTTIHEALEADETVLVRKQHDGYVLAGLSRGAHDRSWCLRPFIDTVRDRVPRLVFDLSRTPGWRLDGEAESFSGSSLLAIGLSPRDKPHVLLCFRRNPPAFSRQALQLFTRIAPLMEESLRREAERVIRERLEAELRSSQKLEALGTLAAGIAHEINTPSQYVGDNLEFLSSAFRDLKSVLSACISLVENLRDHPDFSSDVGHIETLADKADLRYLYDELPTAIEQSRYGIRQISRIVLAMKEFSHPSTKEKCFVDLNKALENTVTISRNEWKHVSRLELCLDPELPTVLCLPGEMNQVFLNLIVNAAHALADAGHTSETGRIVVATAVEDGSAVIRITDNGPGIPLDVQDRIFDPFFTTKVVGKGTGQGLTIARDIVVAKHSGRISFQTWPGEGTTFNLHLPLVPQ